MPLKALRSRTTIRTASYALTAALAATQGGAQHAITAAAETSKAAAAFQHAMIQHAKQGVAHLREELHNAIGGLQETEVSAQKASVAAHIAQSNAAARSEFQGHEFVGAEGGYHH